MFSPYIAYRTDRYIICNDGTEVGFVCTGGFDFSETDDFVLIDGNKLYLKTKILANAFSKMVMPD